MPHAEPRKSRCLLYCFFCVVITLCVADTLGLTADDTQKVGLQGLDTGGPHVTKHPTKKTTNPSGHPSGVRVSSALCAEKLPFPQPGNFLTEQIHQVIT